MGDMHDSKFEVNFTIFTPISSEQLYYFQKVYLKNLFSGYISIL